ncbi:hypothetical protein ISS04_00965 [Candidatus Woesearchaeota archaeon]|nr:hypothetical protein [Candidatus Woesearchaeota archaeon]
MSSKNIFWGTYERHIDERSRVYLNKDYKELIIKEDNKDIILYQKSDRKHNYIKCEPANLKDKLETEFNSIDEKIDFFSSNTTKLDKQGRIRLPKDSLAHLGYETIPGDIIITGFGNSFLLWKPEIRESYKNSKE